MPHHSSRVGSSTRWLRSSSWPFSGNALASQSKRTRPTWNTLIRSPTSPNSCCPKSRCRMPSNVLHQTLEDAAQRAPGRLAVEEGEDPASIITYGDLDALSNRVRDRMRRMGVGRGDRVGIYVRKSIDTVATIFGILKSGAAYTPVDPSAPAARNAYILNDCSVKVVIVEERFATKLGGELSGFGSLPEFLVISGTGGGES